MPTTMKYWFLGLMLEFSSIALAQNAVLNPEKLIRTHFCDSTELVYVNLHDDENTSLKAGLQVFEKGKILELRHTGKRLLGFWAKGCYYEVDPNRIFTNQGIRLSLQQYSRFDSTGFKAIAQFRDSLLAQIKPNFMIVALHNNRKGYSIRLYQKGGIYSQDAALVSINPKLSPQNFFLVTHFQHFVLLRFLKQNVVLQSNKVRDDGSLSVWAQKNDLAYINVEAEEGQFEQQKAMLALLNRYILHDRFFETMRLLKNEEFILEAEKN